MDNKLCLYCGGPGHQVKDCLNTRRRSQPQATATRTENQPRRTPPRELGVLGATRTPKDAGEIPVKKEQTLDVHGNLSWTACYDDACLIHKSEKDGAGWYPSKPKKQKHPITDDRNWHHKFTSWRECTDEKCISHESFKEAHERKMAVINEGYKRLK